MTATAAEIARRFPLDGATVLITGVTSGLGLEATRAFAAGGARVFLIGRDPGRVAALADEVGAIGYAVADLADPESVARAAAGVPAPSVMVLNAGVSRTPAAHTPRGWDVRFATNHLGHFLLASLVRDRLTPQARIVSVSSAAHKGRPVDFDDVHWTKRPRNDLAAYGVSKTANILFTREAQRRWRIPSYAVLPGAALTGLQRYHGDALLREIGLVGPDGRPHPSVRPATVGAASIVWAAVSPDLPPWAIVENCSVASPWAPGTDPWSGYDPEVLGEDSARALWELSDDLLAEFLHRPGY